jgi:tetratricopeptide (TPR) repeat protein
VANVFLSYANEDHARAERVARAIEARGWTVFWDTQLIAGDQFRDVLHRQLEAAQCVVVLWSASSVSSRWVLDEARRGADRDVLVPARIDEVPIPLGFGEAQTADLIGWDGRRTGGRGLEQLLAGIERVVTGERSTPAKRTPRDWLCRQFRFHTIQARVGALAAAAATLVGLVLGGVEIYERWIAGPPPLPAMNGDINVAVAGFDVGEATDPYLARREGESLAGSVYRQLDEELGCVGAAFDCLPPDRVGTFTGNDQDRADAAARLSRQVLADLVVYGTVEEADGRVTFAPEIYVWDRRLIRAAELAGPHTLAAQRGDVSLIPQREELRARVEAQARDLAQLARALGFYAQGDFEEALALVQEAIAADSWEFDAALLHLLAGNLHGKLGDIARAESEYETALDLRDGYGRALVGLAEARYQRSIGDGSCEPGTVDVAGIRDAIQTYEDATSAPIAPAAAFIDEKAAFGVGRSLACLSQAEIADRWSDAETHLRRVIAAYEAQPSPSLEELAAESHALLGLRAFDTADGPAQYQQAVSAYEQAISLSMFEDRQAEWHYYAAVASHRSDDDEAACDHLAQAQELDASSEAADAIVTAFGQYGC